MFDFGDELTIESYRIPWLIWIQVLVLLLLILLYCFTLLALDLPTTSSSASASLCPESQLDNNNPVFKHDTGLVSTCFLASQVGEEQSMKGEIATGTSESIVRGEDHIVVREGCSSKDTNQNRYHPCHYLTLAKLAFLKCLGLDFLSKNSSTSEQRNQR